jgi:acetylglutamate synthase
LVVFSFRDATLVDLSIKINRLEMIGLTPKEDTTPAPIATMKIMYNRTPDIVMVSTFCLKKSKNVRDSE